MCGALLPTHATEQLIKLRFDAGQAFVGFGRFLHACSGARMQPVRWIFLLSMAPAQQAYSVQIRIRQPRKIVPPISLIRPLFFHRLHFGQRSIVWLTPFRAVGRTLSRCLSGVTLHGPSRARAGILLSLLVVMYALFWRMTCLHM